MRPLSSPPSEVLPGGLVTLFYDGDSKDNNRLDFYGRIELRDWTPGVTTVTSAL